MARRDKRQEIMLAAEKLFTNRGLREITLDEVARVARVGKGTIYRYFDDKEDLFFRTATSGFDDLCQLLQQGLREDAPFQERLLHICSRITDFFERRRPLFRMMQAEESLVFGRQNKLGQRWMAERGKLVEAVAEVLHHGVKEGVIRDDIPSRILANYLLGLLRTRVRDLLDDPEELKSIELLLKLFSNGACHAFQEREISKGTRNDV